MEKQQIINITSTGRKDACGLEIKVGDTVNIACNPYHGNYQVKFGEYQMRKFTKADLQKKHLGFYLDNGENVISFLHAIEQPTDHGVSTHRITIRVL